MNTYSVLQALFVFLSFLYIYSNSLRNKHSRLALLNNKKHAETLESKLQSLEKNLESARNSSNDVSKDLFLQRTNNQILIDKVASLKEQIQRLEEKQTSFSIELKTKEEEITRLKNDNQEKSKRLIYLQNEREDLASFFEQQSRIQFQHLQDNILDSIDHFSQSLIEEANERQEKIYETILEELNAQ